MSDVMKMIVLREQENGDMVDLLMVMNYDEKFDAIAEQVAVNYYSPDLSGAAACESIALTDYIIKNLAEAGYFCAVAPWTRIDV